jgi:hypothetical protein
MMSALTRKRDEARRLLELYTIYKDSPDDWRRRKACVDLDRFLMENRETAIMCIERVLSDEIDQQIAEAREHSKIARPSIFKRLAGSLQRRNVQKEESIHDANM